MRRALIVFAKYPVAGAVKTRLTPPFSPGDAARLYAAFLEDSLRRYQAVDADVRLYMAGESEPGGGGDTGAVRSSECGFAVPQGVRLFAQEGNGLGERMSRAFEETFREGYDVAVIVGSDHPTLPTPFIERAFDELRDPAAVVIGPAEDGGYYLLGMNAPHPTLFGEMEFSHGRVFDQTMGRLRQMEASVTVLPSWYDVDRPEELRRLASDLEEDPDLAPRTRAVLGELTRQQGSMAR